MRLSRLHHQHLLFIIQIATSVETGLTGWFCRIQGGPIDIRDKYTSLECQPPLFRHPAFTETLVFTQYSRIFRLFIFAVRYDLFTAQHHFLKQENVIISRLIRFGDCEMVVEP